jgi:hypothetical protein
MISAKGSPERRIKTGRPVRRTFSRTSKQFARKLAMAMLSMDKNLT